MSAELALGIGLAVFGALAAGALACVPGLHVYNVLGILAAVFFHRETGGCPLPPFAVAALFAGMTVGYTVLSAVPSVLLSAPDESALFTVLPGHRYLLRGRGVEAVRAIATGSLLGLAVTLALAWAAAPVALPALRALLAPHWHWVLWCVIAFMLMSEWPRGGGPGPAGWRRFADNWRGTAMGLVTFAASGLLGCLLSFRSPLAPASAYQNLLPAFAGLFTLPWLIMNTVSGGRPPPQRTGRPEAAGREDTVRRATLAVCKGTLSGVAGGAFAALAPGVTGGVGAFLAGHAFSVRDDRQFLVSQGASRAAYYVGGLLFLFVPGARLARGGAASLLRGFQPPDTPETFLAMLAALALAGAASALLIGPLSRATLFATRRAGYRPLSVAGLLFILGLVFFQTGLAGLAVTATAAGIGLLPVLFGARRMNALGVILLPLALSMSGQGPAVARWLGLDR